jgi:hypothetical protein
MKRMLMALAVAAGLTAAAGSVRADPGGYAPPGPNGAAQLPPPGSFSGPNTLLGMGAPGAMGPGGMYGLNPSLRKAFRTGGCGYGCAGCAGGPGGYGYGPSYPGGQMMQGTLVFPNHPFVRSPRDFFMYEPNK